MRRMILASLFVLFVVSAANNVCAQRHGGTGPGFAHRGFGFNRGFNRGRFVSPNGFGYGYLPYDDYGTAYDYAAQPASFIQPPPFVQPPAPPVVQTPTTHLVIKEYEWPAAGRASSTTASKAQPFAIVLKDGSSLSAVAVFESDDGLHYVDPDDRQLRISMSEIDRAATLKLNRERNLNLHLPADN